MENVTDALKMAGAMLIFVGAITITIFVFSKAREASTEIMAQYDRNKTFYNLDNINFTSEREVGVDAVISNLYSYYQTQNTIVFYTGKVDSTGRLIDGSNEGEVNTVNKMSLYQTKASENTLKKSSLVIAESQNVFGLDINDEAIREEQWVNGEERRKQFVDLLINHDNGTLGWMERNSTDPRSIFNTSRPRSILFNYDGVTSDSFVNIGKRNAKFIERIGEYNRDLETSDDIDETTGNVERTDEGDIVGEFDGLVVDSSVIKFKETDETIDNSNGDKKKIIEYIYIKQN